MIAVPVSILMHILIKSVCRAAVSLLTASFPLAQPHQNIYAQNYAHQEPPHEIYRHMQAELATQQQQQALGNQQAHRPSPNVIPTSQPPAPGARLRCPPAQQGLPGRGRAVKRPGAAPVSCKFDALLILSCFALLFFVLMST